MRPNRFLLCAAVAALTVLATSGAALAAPDAIYFVRHAEKAALGKDPDLTPQGQERARKLAAILHKAGVSAIFSTPTARTRQTAEPLSQRTGVPVQLYDPSAPALLVEKVRALNGAVLVVGHSNTVPQLVKLFGGAPGADIADDEFDRLYQLLPEANGQVRTILLGTP